MNWRSMKILALSLLICCSTAVMRAQQHENQISVTGDATVNVAPDKVEITLGVETTAIAVGTAKAANDAACAAVLAAVKNLGVAAKDIKTDYVSIVPEYADYNHKSLQPIGYMVRKSIVVTLHDVPKFDALMSAAVEAGANVVQSVDFQTSDLRKYRDQAREMAIKAAREKAVLLTGALGQKVGKAIMISEGGNNLWSSYGNSWNNRGNMAMMQNAVQNAGGGEPAAGETTAPGMVQVRASVSVQFQLLP